MREAAETGRIVRLYQALQIQTRVVLTLMKQLRPKEVGAAVREEPTNTCCKMTEYTERP